MVAVKAKQSFVHGSFEARKGTQVDLPASVVADLEKVGLVARAEDADESSPPGVKAASDAPKGGEKSRTQPANKKRLQHEDKGAEGELASGASE
ncbi:MAG: hypothetical protein QM639_09690 [Rhodocyclaceae bacterium]